MPAATESQDFPHIPGVEYWRCYGVVWPDRLTSNGNPHAVREYVARSHPRALQAFDAWVSDVMGWPVDWKDVNRCAAPDPV